MSRAGRTRPAAALWSLAHRGHCGAGRLDVWLYFTETDALRAAAQLAMDSGLDEDPLSTAAMAERDYRTVIERYETSSPDRHVLRVQQAFLDVDTDPR